MSFNVLGQPISEWVRITGNTSTTVFTATKKTTVVSMRFTCTSGTPTLTVLRNDGTDDHYFRNAIALTTAKETVVFDEVFTLAVGDTIKAQSNSATGDFHVRLLYLAPDAGATRG